MRPELVYVKLKNETIPMNKDTFLRSIKDIITDTASKETALKLLTECLEDEDRAIETFVNRPYATNWAENASELYGLLIADMHLNFRKSIEKKFVKTKNSPLKVQKEMSKRDLKSKMMSLSDIKIPAKLKNSLPSERKMVKEWRFYKEHASFTNNIIVDDENFLKEGYIKYLFCKMLDISDVLVYNADVAKVSD